MRTLRISASFGGKIPTGSFQNMNPSFYAEETVEFPNELKDDEANLYISLRQKELQGICYGNFEAEAIKAKLLKIKSDRKDFRFYPLKDGTEVPSVTSVLGYDTDWGIEEDELNQYAAQGNIIHAQVHSYIKDGKWREPKDIPGLTPDIFILKSGALHLPLEGWNFEAFLNKHPIKEMKNGRRIVNEKDRYGGEYDLEGLYDSVPTLCDVKRTPDKIKNFMQIAAYAKGEGMGHIKQMMIIPLNDKTDQGFSKPIVSRDIDKFYELFLAKRKEFKRVYGI